MRTNRHPVIDGQIAVVPLTKGYTAIIDAIDVPLVEGRSWAAKESGTTNVYAVCSFRIGKGRGHGVGKTRNLLMHHAIIGSPLPGSEVDHINHNGLDNRRSNLRFVDKSGNALNRRWFPRESGLPKGVRRDGRCFQAAIKIRGAMRFLGSFKTPEAASNAYKEAVRVALP